MAVVKDAIEEAGFPLMPILDGPVIRCVKDSAARERYYVRIAEPADDDDEGKANNRKRHAWLRNVKSALDAKLLMAAPYGEDRVLWIP